MAKWEWAGGQEGPSCHQSTPDTQLSPHWSYPGYAKHNPKAACVFSFSLTQWQGRSSSMSVSLPCGQIRDRASAISAEGNPKGLLARLCLCWSRAATRHFCFLQSLPLWWYTDTPCIPWDFLQAPSVLNIPLRRFNTGASSLASAGLAFHGRCSAALATGSPL